MVAYPGNLSDAPAIKDVAEALSVSEAMIVKVSKLLGFSGFRNLRSALEAYFSQSEQVLPTELSFDDAPQDVVNKVFNITLRTIMEGQSIVNVDEIHRAARFLPKPTSATCTARAAPTPSAPTCSISFTHRRTLPGLPGRAYHDDVRLAAEGRRCRAGGLSLRAHQRYQISGGAGEKNGAKIICITHSYHSPIAKLADFIICSPAPETPLLGRNASARILQLTLLDAFLFPLHSSTLSKRI